MKKKFSLYTIAGLLIFVIHQIVSRFLTPLPNWLSIISLLIAVILILYGGIVKRNK